MPDRYWSSDMDAELFDPRTAFAELGMIMLDVHDMASLGPRESVDPRLTRGAAYLSAP